MIRSDADALVRQLRGYIRVLKNPPRGDPERPGDEEKALRETRTLMANLFASEFTALDEFLTTGGELPEEWDRKMRNQYRTRIHSGDFRYLVVPGHVVPACQRGPRKVACRWLNSDAVLSVCQRCHTIRIKVK